VRSVPTAEPAAAPPSLQRLPRRSPLPSLDGRPLCAQHPAVRTSRRHCDPSGKLHAEHYHLRRRVRSSGLPGCQAHAAGELPHCEVVSCPPP
jgi:hypothetical protein